MGYRHKDHLSYIGQFRNALGADRPLLETFNDRLDLTQVNFRIFAAPVDALVKGAKCK